MSQTPELWAHCVPCGRWFNVAFTTTERMTRTTCVRCDAHPARFEVRLESSSFPVEIEHGRLRVVRRGSSREDTPSVGEV